MFISKDILIEDNKMFLPDFSEQELDEAISERVVSDIELLFNGNTKFALTFKVAGATVFSKEFPATEFDRLKAKYKWK